MSFEGTRPKMLGRKSAARIVSALVWLTLLTQTGCAGQQKGARPEAGGRISAEVQRLRGVLAAAGLPEAEARQQEAELRRVEESLRAGRISLGLYRLQQIHSTVMAGEYGRRKAEVLKQGTEGFEREWKRLGEELAAKEKSLGAGGKLPAAVAALAEASLTQVRPHYEAGRLYGLNTTLDAGLYYMGAASAGMDFALFCHGLNFGSKETGTTKELRPLDAELARLEAETLTAYRRPGAASQQGRFNALNSTLKMAGELNGERRFAGALFKYLEARRVLAHIEAADSAPPAAASLREKSDAARSKLEGAGGREQGVGLLFWEMARTALEGSEAGSPNEDELRRADAILERVLPSYFEYMAGEKK